MSWLPKDSSRGFWGSVTAFLLICAWMAAIGNIGKATLLFSSLYLLAFVLLFLMMRWFPREWTTRQQWIVLLGMAIVARFLFLDFAPSDDICRYIWEGYLLNKGYNPFFHAPDSPVVEPFIRELPQIWQEINHKDATACYPPLSMLLFRAAAFIAPTKTFFNLIILLFDLATVVILLLILREKQLPLARILLYALNPLVLVFLAGEGHLDAIQNFFIWLGIYFLLRQHPRRGFIALGCAIMSKYFSVLLIPFLLTKKHAKYLLAFFATILLLYLPFWQTGSRLFTSLQPFGLVMHYNDSLTVYLRSWFGSSATLVSLILLTGCCALIFLVVHDRLKSCYLAVACLLLLISTLHPWYLTLLTPFLIFFPSRAWLWLHAGVVFTFPVLHYAYYTGVFQEIHWIKWFEYLPFYAILLWDILRNRPYFTGRDFRPVKDLSVIIPTLNEAQHIRQCLASLAQEKAVREIIVVDGGSTDDTRAIVSQSGDRVLEASKGRGLQIRAGVEQANGDVIMILHADCQLVQGISERIIAALQKYPQYPGGAVGMRYAQRPFSSRIVEWLNNGRARWTGIAFGDQAQFFRREALSLFGGMPEQMLMEDVELSMRLKEIGSVCFLPQGVTVSNRRWTQKGFCVNFCRVIRFCFSYLIQRRLEFGDSTRRDFYERYYT